MPDWAVDLYSDTKTRPSAAMRAAMAAADVGDEQQDEDPTVTALNARVAALLGKPDALFLPSGTMANLCAVLVHCGRGDEILAAASSHVLHFETGAPAAIAGATVTALPDNGGVFGVDQLRAALRSKRRNAPRPRLVWIEQTTNLGGGRVWPLQTLQDIRDFADERGLTVHIDGARLLNAAAAADVSPALYGSIADSLWLDFSKGLGAPFGAALAGSADFIERARRYKHMLGGAMRQAGIMAAACDYALDHHVDRLADDHTAARALAAGLRTLPSLTVTPPETNIVIIDTAGTAMDAAAIAAHIEAAGIRVGVFGLSTLRAITHLDIPAGGIARAIDAFRAALT